MGKPRPGGFITAPLPKNSLLRLVVARESGASVQDLAGRFDRSPAWIRTTLQCLQAGSSSDATSQATL